MIDNTALFAELFETRDMDLERVPFLDSPPPKVPLEGIEGRIKGMLLGAAIGESLEQ